MHRNFRRAVPATMLAVLIGLLATGHPPSAKPVEPTAAVASAQAALGAMRATLA